VDERLGGLGQEVQSQLKDALGGVWAEQRSSLMDLFVGERELVGEREWE
jgi:hypothetical protein